MASYLSRCDLTKHVFWDTAEKFFAVTELHLNSAIFSHTQHVFKRTRNGNKVNNI